MRKLKVLTISLMMLLVAIVAGIGGASVIGPVQANSTPKVLFVGYSSVLSTENWNSWRDSAKNATTESVKQGDPQITVLTHGLGGGAYNFSNDGNTKGPSFAEDKDSIVSKLNIQAGEAQTYWARMDSKSSFYFISINEQTGSASYNTSSNQVESITDISKHIIIIFDSSDSDASHEYVYNEFRYMLDKIVYDVWHLNGGLFPRINFIGHSRGGITNLQYALEYPNLIDSVFSLGTPYFGSSTLEFANAWNLPLLDDFIDVTNGGGKDILDWRKGDFLENTLTKWNNGYDTKYKHINYHAIGGYQTVKFLGDTTKQYTKLDGCAITTLLKIIGPCVDIWALGARTFGTADTLSKVIKDIGYENVGEMLIFKKTFYNDLLVHLDSQLGKESTVYTYKGFTRYSKRFTPKDLKNHKSADSSMPPIVHNLETYDNQLINYILSKIKLGNVAVDDFSAYDNGDDGVTIFAYNGNATHVIIPSTIDGKPVTEIAPSAFADNFYGKNVTSVTLPATLKRIGMAAFEGCTALQTVILPPNNNLQVIDHAAFSGATNLQSFDLSGIIELGDEVFDGNRTMTGIQLGAGLIRLSYTSFINTNLTSISIDSANVYYTVHNGAVYSKDYSRLIHVPSNLNIATLNLHTSTIEIDSFAVANINLTSVNLANVKIVGDFAFMGSGNIVSFSGGAEIHTVGEYAFSDTDWYKNLCATVNDFVGIGKTILTYAGNKTILEASDFPVNTVSIAPYAFSTDDQNRNGYSGTVESVSIPKQISQIGVYAFAGSANLISVEFDTNSAVTVFEYGLFYGTGLITLTIPGNVQEFGLGSISGCMDLEEVTFLTQFVPNIYRDNFTNVHTIYIARPLVTQFTDKLLSVGYEGTISFISTTVSFDTKGTGSVPDKVVYNLEYEDLNLLTPTKMGYDFSGWYFSEDITESNKWFGTWYNNSQFVTLYAGWTPQTFTIVLDAQNGSTPTFVSVAFDSAMPAEDTPELTGFTFAGYFDTANAIGGIQYYDVDMQSARNWDKTNTVTLYARWTANTYTVTLNDNSGAGGTASVTATYNQGMPTAIPPTRTGYAFAGYFDTNADMGGTQYYYADMTSVKDWDKTSNTTLHARWIANTYSIALNHNGGFGGSTSVTVTFAGSMPSATAPTRAGYIFAGYFDTSAATGGAQYYTATMQSAENWDQSTAVTFYARWTPIVYTVSFNTNGGTAVTDQTVTFGAAFSFTTIPTKTGYVFDGWFDTAGTRYTNKNGVGVIDNWDKAANTTLLAGWQIKKFELALETSGQWISISSSILGLSDVKVEVEYGASLSNSIHNALIAKFQQENPRTGYTLKGFSNNGVAITDWGNVIPDLGVNKITLTPIWEANKHTVTLNHNNGTSGTASVTATYDQAMPAATTPARTGYTFQGYFDTSAATGGTQYYTALMQSARVWNKTSNTTLYARWAANTYTVTLNNNSGTGGTTSVSATFGSAMPTATAPARTGYTFAGYYDATLGGTQYYYANMTSAKILDKTSNTTLYARWTAIQYAVTLNNNSGTGGTASVTATFGSVMPAATAPTRAGYTFAGYFDTSAASGGTQYYNSNMTSARNWDKAGTATLYARWTANLYTITLNLNGGTGVIASVPVTFAQAMPQAAVPTRKGYSFTGYFDTSAATGGLQYYNANMSSAKTWDKTSNTTLWARWTLNTYTIKFATNGGTTIADRTFNATSHNTTAFASPERLMYQFNRWTVNQTSNVATHTTTLWNNLESYGNVNQSFIITLNAVWDGVSKTPTSGVMTFTEKVVMIDFTSSSPAATEYKISSSVEEVSLFKSGSVMTLSNSKIVIEDRTTNLTIRLINIKMTAPNGNSAISSTGRFCLTLDLIGTTSIIGGNGLAGTVGYLAIKHESTVEIISRIDLTATLTNPGTLTHSISITGGNGGNGVAGLSYIGDPGRAPATVLKAGSDGTKGRSGGNGGRGGNGGDGISANYVYIDIPASVTLEIKGGNGGTGGAGGRGEGARGSGQDIKGGKGGDAGKGGDGGNGIVITNPPKNTGPTILVSNPNVGYIGITVAGSLTLRGGNGALGGIGGGGGGGSDHGSEHKEHAGNGGNGGAGGHGGHGILLPSNATISLTGTNKITLVGGTAGNGGDGGTGGNASKGGGVIKTGTRGLGGNGGNGGKSGDGAATGNNANKNAFSSAAFTAGTGGTGGAVGANGVAVVNGANGTPGNAPTGTVIKGLNGIAGIKIS